MDGIYESNFVVCYVLSKWNFCACTYSVHHLHFISPHRSVTPPLPQVPHEITSLPTAHSSLRRRRSHRTKTTSATKVPPPFLATLPPHFCSQILSFEWPLIRKNFSRAQRFQRGRSEGGTPAPLRQQMVSYRFSPSGHHERVPDQISALKPGNIPQPFALHG